MIALLEKVVFIVLNSTFGSLVASISFISFSRYFSCSFIWCIFLCLPIFMHVCVCLSVLGRSALTLILDMTALWYRCLVGLSGTVFQITWAIETREERSKLIPIGDSVSGTYRREARTSLLPGSTASEPSACPESWRRPSERDVIQSPQKIIFKCSLYGLESLKNRRCLSHWPLKKSF